MRQIASGLCFPEAPRWHEGRLWFSDRDAPAVFAMELDREPTVVAEVPTKAMGLGFLDGNAHVVSQAERRIFRCLPNGSLELFADLSHVTPHWLNDLLLLPDGSGYVGSFGFDLMNREESRSTPLIRLTADGRGHFTGPQLHFPNGIQMMPTGELAVAESFGSTVSALTLDDAGEVVGRRVVSDLGGHGHPDGIAVDSEGGIWYADTIGGFVARLGRDGQETEHITVPAAHATAVAFVGEAGNQLAITATDDLFPPEAMANRTGRIYLHEVRARALWAEAEAEKMGAPA